MPRNPYYSVGHSNRPLEEFVEILQSAAIQFLADIRSIPRSRHNPQFNRDVLPASLAEYGMEYGYFGDLGGRRSKSKTVPPEVNGFWTHPAFHSYADYALSAPFREGLEALVRQGQEKRLAYMCSEAVWWRCHRRIVSDYLLARGEQVFHLMGAGKIVPASLTPGAVVESPDRIVYPPPQESLGLV